LLALPAALSLATATPLAAAPVVGREAAVGAIMAEAARDPNELRLFLHRLPKGGDLHNHLSGALYAEDMIAWAGEKGLCLAPDGAGFVAPPCAPGAAVADVAKDRPALYGALVDSLSTRGWQAGWARARAAAMTSSSPRSNALPRR
jgi:adenosine deaminase